MTASWDVPFNDLRPATNPIRTDIERAISRVVDSGIYLNGPEVEAFEAEWARYCGTDYCVACASGTDALTLLARTCDNPILKVQANTCGWTLKGLHNGGCTVKIVDCDADGRLSQNSPDEGANVPVLLYGRYPANVMEAACQMLDACQAHGYKPRRWQTAAYSHYPTKNLGGPGDGGSLVTNVEDIAVRARLIAREMHSRMSEITAAVLRVKLPHLDEWNAERHRLAGVYYENLPPSVQPVSPPGTETNHHLFAVLVDERDKVRASLALRDIHTAVHYAEPLAPLENAERWCSWVLSLPFYVGMRNEDVRKVCDVLRSII